MGWTGSEFCVKIGAELAQAEIRLIGWKARSSAPEIHVMVQYIHCQRGVVHGAEADQGDVVVCIPSNRSGTWVAQNCVPSGIRNAQLRIVRWLPEDVEED